MATTSTLPELTTDSAPERKARLRDRFGRAITDLRVSVTDRCNYRCAYCRSADGQMPTTGELGLADFRDMIRLLVGLGVEKVRLTGGEPLLWRELVPLVESIHAMPCAFAGSGNRSGKPEIALTTNGHLLAGMTTRLQRAGLSRVTVSMDGVSPEAFERMTRVPNSLARVLDGIHAAQDAGLGPVKVNCVLMRGWNDDQIEAFGEFARREKVILRFIEFMPLGEDRNWSSDVVVREAEILERLSRVHPLRLLPANHSSETARRYAYMDGSGEIGIIAPVSRPFCGHCSRIRLTSDGKLRTCLFSQTEHNLIARLRAGADPEQLESFVRSVIAQKEERHHIGETGFQQPSRGMVQIGG